MKLPLVRNVLLALGIGIFVTALYSWFSLERVPANEDKKAALNAPPTLSLKTNDYQPASARDIKRCRELSGKRASEATDLAASLPGASGLPPTSYLTAIHSKDLQLPPESVQPDNKVEAPPHHWKYEPPSPSIPFHELAIRQVTQQYSSWKQFPILFVTSSSVSVCTSWLIARMSGRETPWS